MMHLLFFSSLLITVVTIPGTLSISPGDPLKIDLNNNPDKFDSLNSNNISNKTVSSPIPSSNVNKTLVANQNEIINLLFSSTLKPTEKTLLIYKKHLVDIAQWKYTDPRTHEIRYWYHIAGSSMGSGWIFDGILCQGYSRQKLDTIPIQAFHSEGDGIWSNTLQIESAPVPIGANQWKYDGIPFYAYKTSMNSSLLKPVWRYWNRINYGTEDVNEPRRSFLRMGDIVNDDLPGWRLDRIVFYAFSPRMNVTELKN